MYSNTVNSYIVCELNTGPRNPTNNFTLKKFFFGAVKLTRNLDKIKFTYNVWGIAFNGKGLWGFDNDTARNIIIFGVYYSLSPHIDNPKNNFLVSGEGLTEFINGSAGAAEKK